MIFTFRGAFQSRYVMSPATIRVSPASFRMMRHPLLSTSDTVPRTVPLFVTAWISLPRMSDLSNHSRLIGSWSPALTLRYSASMWERKQRSSLTLETFRHYVGRLAPRPLPDDPGPTAS